jgi:hypothetical protein
MEGMLPSPEKRSELLLGGFSIPDEAVLAFMWLDWGPPHPAFSVRYEQFIASLARFLFRIEDLVPGAV